MRNQTSCNIWEKKKANGGVGGDAAKAGTGVNSELILWASAVAAVLVPDRSIARQKQKPFLPFIYLQLLVRSFSYPSNNRVF
jgi:hypothetical protein